MGALPPIKILGFFDAGKRPDDVMYGAIHGKVGGDRKLARFNVHFLAKAEHCFIGFDW